MFEVIDDTIVAISSPPGWGVRGIVRLSGPDAIAIADGLFVAADGRPLTGRKGFSRISGLVRPEQGVGLPAEVYLFRAPRSYTRQDCVEIHTVGSPPALAMVVEAAQSAGARPAEPGEFTARAFLSGAMDLSQAEAVAATIRARSDTQLRAARKLQQGELTRRIIAWRDRLGELLARVEADIDFAEEPIEFITPDELRRQLADLARDIDALRAEADSTERFDVLPTVLLVGKPNAGKSRLMNALSGLDRAICSAVAGTTRDILSAPIRLGPAEAMLLDAAGPPRIARVEGSHEGPDELMQEAWRRALAAAEQVDLVCLVVDLSLEPDGTEFDCLRSAQAPCILVGNKADLTNGPTASCRATSLAQIAPSCVVDVCTISAATGAGLDRLRNSIAGQLGDPAALGEDKTILLTARHRGSLASATAALARAVTEAAHIGRTIDRAEFVAFELREALDALGEVIGEVTTEDLLATVFANFCIGK